MIRLATEQDIPRLVELSLEFHKLTSYDIPACVDSIEATCEYCISIDFLYVLELDGIVQGLAAGIVAPYMFNASHQVGCEVAWYVDPEYRTGRHGVNLLLALEKQAKAKGCTLWTMMYMESSMPEVIQSVYERMGYTKTEVSYTKEL